MNNKERKLKQILEGGKGDLNTDQLWMNISDRLPKQERRRMAYWWLLLLLIPLGASIYYLVHNSSEEALLYVDHKEDKIKRAESELRVNEAKIQAKSNDEVSTSKISENLNIFDAQNDLIVSKSDREPNVRKIGEKNSNFGSKAYEILNNPPKFSVQETASGKEFSQKNAQYSDKSIIHNKAQNKELIPQHVIALLPVSLEQVAPIEAIGITFNIDKEEKEINKLIIPSINHARRFGITLAAGSSKSLDRLEGIRSYETGLYGTSFSAGVEYYTKKRWTLKIGLSHNNYISRYYNNEEEIVANTTQGTSEIQINAQGSESAVSGEVKTIAFTKNDISWHRRHQALDLEVLLRRNIPIAARWVAGFDVGIAYNLITKSKGYGYEVNDGDQQFVKFEKDPGIYKKGTGWKPMLGAEIAYRFINTEVLLRADYQWILNPINIETTIYQIKHSQTGIQLGMRYYLNGNKN